MNGFMGKKDRETILFDVNKLLNNLKKTATYCEQFKFSRY